MIPSNMPHGIESGVSYSNDAFSYIIDDYLYNEGLEWWG